MKKPRGDVPPLRRSVLVELNYLVASPATTRRPARGAESV